MRPRERKEANKQDRSSGNKREMLLGRIDKGVFTYHQQCEEEVDNANREFCIKIDYK